MKWRVSCVTYDPKFRPTIQCQVGLYFLSNSFLMYAAISWKEKYQSVSFCLYCKTQKCNFSIGNMHGNLSWTLHPTSNLLHLEFFMKLGIPVPKPSSLTSFLLFLTNFKSYKTKNFVDYGVVTKYYLQYATMICF